MTQLAHKGPGIILVSAAVAVDLVLLAVSAVLSATLLGLDRPFVFEGSYADWVLFSIFSSITFVLVLVGGNGYSRALWTSGIELYSYVLKAAPTAIAISLTLAFFFARDVGGAFILLFFGFSLVLVLLERSVLRALVHALHRRGRLLAGVIVVGEPELVHVVLERLQARGFVGHSVVGVLHQEGHGFRDDDGGLVADGLNDLANFVLDRPVSQIIICGGGHSAEEIDSFCWRLRGTGVSVDLAIDTAQGSYPIVEFRVTSGLPLLSVSPPSLSAQGRAAKRAFDLTVSALLLILTLPVILIVAVAILLEDGRPVLFRQDRVGLDQSIFECLKFRSMYKDAAVRESELRRKHHRPGQMWKVDNDPRVTRVGRFIRATSLDELPQLINVLRGDMSMVGPRPKQEWELVDYSSVQMRRFAMKPGLTGLSQVSGRSDLSVDESCRLDLDYLQNWSVFVDLAICIRTVAVVVRGSGAY